MKNFFIALFKFVREKIILISLFLFILLLDQITKIIFDGKFINLIDGVFSFTSTHNTGAGFSILEGKVWLLIAFTILFLIAIFIFNHFQKSKTKLYNVSLVLIVSGAIGNLIDRVFLGYVRDFLSFDLIHFPVFNIADICLTIGVILLCVFLLFFDRQKKEKEQHTENDNTKSN